MRHNRVRDGTMMRTSKSKFLVISYNIPDRGQHSILKLDQGPNFSLSGRLVNSFESDIMVPLDLLHAKPPCPNWTSTRNTQLCDRV